MHIDLSRTTRSIGLLVAMAALSLAAPAMAANIVANGGFETGDLTSWSGTVLSNPYSGVYCPGAGTSPEGNCEVFLGTDGSASTLSQVLSTVAGQTYSVSFSFKADGSTPSSFSVSFGNQSLYTVTSPVSAAPQTFTFSAAAVGTSTALVFNFRNDPGYFFVDAVSAAPVPEPGSVALTAVGLVALLARRKWALRKG